MLDLADLDALLDIVATHEFPAQDGSALRAFLARHGQDRSTLVLVAHHTTADPWSMEILGRDLAAAYTARAEGLPPAPVSEHRYSDSTARALARLRGPRVPRRLEHWAKTLLDVRGLAAPAAGPASFAESALPLRVTEAEVAGAGQALRTTPFVVLLTAYLLALHDLTGDTDLTVPVLTYGRERADWETVGLFMNAVVTRTDLAEVEGLAEAVRRVHASFVAAYGNELPLSYLFAELPAVRDLFHGHGVPLAQFELIQLPPAAGSGPGATGLTVTRLRVPAGPPLALAGAVLPVNGLLCCLESEPDGSYRATIRYRRELFDESWIQRLGRRFSQLIDELVASTRRNSVVPE